MLQAAFGRYHVWWLIPVLIFVYIVSDCLDGAQARRTKMFSPVRLFLTGSCIAAFINIIMSLERAKEVSVKFLSFGLSSLLVAITMQQKDKYPDVGFPIILVVVLFIGSCQYLYFALCLVYLIFNVNLFEFFLD